MREYLSKLRKDYGKAGLLEADLDPSPIIQFEKWMTEAANEEIVEPNAMTLCTVNKEGKPSSRIVLLRNFDEKGFVWYTNYQSDKGKDLAENPNACLNIFWPDMERQVRIEGMVEKINTWDSMEYFKSRPRASQIGAWASAQSEIIPNRDFLENQIKELEMKFKNHEIEKPPFWGGYRLIPDNIEFWQGRPSRLHDRLKYILEGNNWKIIRLSP